MHPFSLLKECFQGVLKVVLWTLACSCRKKKAVCYMRSYVCKSHKDYSCWPLAGDLITQTGKLSCFTWLSKQLLWDRWGCPGCHSRAVLVLHSLAAVLGSTTAMCQTKWAVPNGCSCLGLSNWKVTRLPACAMCLLIQSLLLRAVC